MKLKITKINLLTAAAILFLLLSRSAWAQSATLTPPCDPAGVLGNNATNTWGTTYDDMIGSVFSLTSPATVYSLTVFCESPLINQQLITGIYSGSAGHFGSLIVQSAAQTLAYGWNGFPLTPTYLTAGTYWLAYLSNETGYDSTFTSSASVSIQAYTNYSITFSDGLPSTMPTPSYGTNKEAIYALYCTLPTNTTTDTDTATITLTPTNTMTNTCSDTPTNTGTIFTDTPSSTPTQTPTLTATDTCTLTPTATPNLSLTPFCGSSMGSFGDSDTAGLPVTASYTVELRACRYTLISDSTLQTMSLYATSYSAGSTAEVALYTNSASTTTMGSLVVQSGMQTLEAGWNVFQMPTTILTAGDYWLAYIFDTPVGYSLVYQTSPAGMNTAASVTQGLSWTFADSGSTYSAFYQSSWHEPILVNFCPGINTSTPLNTATTTGTSTPTDTATDSATATPTSSPTLTVTSTTSLTSTNTATITFTCTSTDTATDSATSTLTNTATNTGTATVSNTATNTSTITQTSTDTSTNTSTDSPTNTATITLTNTVTNTGTATVSNTVTNTFTITMTPTDTSSNTSTDTSTNTATTTLTDTPTNTGTASTTATPTSSPTLTATPTVSATSSNTATITATPVFSYTFTETVISTDTSTPTLSMTNTATYTSTSTISATFTATLTNTAANTGSPEATATFTQTLTPTLVLTVNLTNTSTVTSPPTSSVVNNLFMFPNPVPGLSSVSLQIVFTEPHDYVEIKVFTLALRKIYDDRVNYAPAGVFNYSLDLSKLKGNLPVANGLYYVLVTTPSNRWMVKLLVLR